MRVWAAAKISVEGVYAVVFSGNDDDVMNAENRDGDIAKDKGLAVDVAVDGEAADFAKGAAADVGWGEQDFVGVKTAACQVVVVGGNVDGTRQVASNHSF